MVCIKNIKFIGIIIDFKQAELAKKYRANTVEIRIDLGKKLQNFDCLLNLINKIKTELNLDIIATIRLQKEGGKYIKDDIKRFELFKKLSHYVDYIDIELYSKYTKLLKMYIKQNNLKTKLIISYHNFKNTPDKTKLIEIINNADKLLPDMIKIATFVNNSNDLIKLIEIQKKSKKLSIITMSDMWYSYFGRILFPLLGSQLVYGYTDKKVVLGQLSIQELSKIILSFSDFF